MSLLPEILSILRERGPLKHDDLTNEFKGRSELAIYGALRLLEKEGKISLEKTTGGTTIHVLGQERTSEPQGVELIATLPSNSKERRSTSCAMLNLLRDAKSEIVLLAPFIDTFFTSKYRHTLKMLAKRQVQLTVYTRKVAETPEQQKSVKELIEIFGNNIVIYELLSQRGNHPNKRQTFALHAKCMIIDRRRAYVGSANMTRLSLFKNFELGVIISQPESIRELETVIRQWREFAKPYSLDHQK